MFFHNEFSDDENHPNSRDDVLPSSVSKGMSGTGLETTYYPLYKEDDILSDLEDDAEGDTRATENALYLSPENCPACIVHADHPDFKRAAAFVEEYKDTLNIRCIAKEIKLMYDEAIKPHNNTLPEWSVSGIEDHYLRHLHGNTTLQRKKLREWTFDVLGEIVKSIRSKTGSNCKQLDDKRIRSFVTVARLYMSQSNLTSTSATHSMK